MSIANSPYIIERRYKKAKCKDSFIRTGNEKRLTLLSNNEDPLQIDLLKQISLKQFCSDKSARISSLLL
jgi:hypothetical protein